MTIQQAQKYGREILSANNTVTASHSVNLDTDVFLQGILNCDRTFLLFHRDTVLTEKQESLYKEWIELRNTGLPVAYITSRKEFFGYSFYVNKNVLIPKPDTELLVEKGIEAFEEKYAVTGEKILTVCDMCTGSGCVGISFLKHIFDSNLCKKDRLPLVVMCDINEEALSVARKNAEQLLSPECLEKMRFVRTNLFSAVTGSFDIILTNPPYVPAEESYKLLEDGRSEPILALNGDMEITGDPSFTKDGLALMRNLVPQAVEKLSPDGILIAEAGEYNAEMTESIFKENGLKNTKIFTDLEGQLRDIYGEKL